MIAGHRSTAVNAVMEHLAGTQDWLRPGAIANAVGQELAAVRKILQHLKFKGVVVSRYERNEADRVAYKLAQQPERADPRKFVGTVYEPRPWSPTREGAMDFAAVPSLAGGQRVGYRPPILNCGKVTGDTAFSAPRITMRNLE